MDEHARRLARVAREARICARRSAADDRPRPEDVDSTGAGRPMRRIALTLEARTASRAAARTAGCLASPELAVRGPYQQLSAAKRG